jgi:hypothetical protein
MTKENLLYILLGLVVGYLAWEEFSPSKCSCHKRRVGAPANNSVQNKQPMPPPCGGGTTWGGLSQ